MYKFFFQFLNFINLRNIVVNSNKFFNNSWNFNNTILSLNNRFSNSSLNFFHNLIIVRNYFLDFLQDFPSNGLFNDSFDLFNSDVVNLYLHDVFDFLNNMNKFFDFPVNRNNNLNNFVDWDRNFNRNNNRFFDFNNFFNFNNFRNDSIDFNVSRNLYSSLHNSFGLFLNNLHHFDSFFNWDNLINEFFNNSIDFSVDIVNLFNFDDSVLNDGNLN